MTLTIICAALMIAVAAAGYDYHEDLRNIAHQLSRIADALNRERGEE